MIPISIFQDRDLGAIEALIFYLSTELCLKNYEIAKLLNRDTRNTSTQLKMAKIKKGWFK